MSKKNFFTKRRKMVLELIKNSSVPLSAKKVYSSFKKKMDLATVYRILQYLELNSFIDSFTIVCTKEGTVRYFYAKNNPHNHWFHCTSCHTFLPVKCFKDKLKSMVTNTESLKGALIHNHIIYFTGICSKCNI